MYTNTIEWLKYAIQVPIDVLEDNSDIVIIGIISCVRTSNIQLLPTKTNEWIGWPCANLVSYTTAIGTVWRVWSSKVLFVSHHSLLTGEVSGDRCLSLLGRLKRPL